MYISPLATSSSYERKSLVEVVIGGKSGSYELEPVGILVGLDELVDVPI